MTSVVFPFLVTLSVLPRDVGSAIGSKSGACSDSEKKYRPIRYAYAKCLILYSPPQELSERKLYSVYKCYFMIGLQSQNFYLKII